MTPRSVNILLLMCLMSVSGVHCGPSVNYPFKRVCGLKGASVDLPCTYDYPWGHIYIRGEWYRERSGRVSSYNNPKYPDCSLKLNTLSDEDSDVYHFRFYTSLHPNWTASKPEIRLSVTDVQLQVDPTTATEGERVTLTCSTACALTENPTFTWFKNRQRIRNQQSSRDTKLHLSPVSSEDAGSYSCAVGGHENLPSSAMALSVRYAPRNTSASVSPSGNMTEGSSVNFTCSSDANPPVSNYTWYKSSGNETILRGTGPHLKLTLASGDGGVYHCQALNEMGSQNSTGVEVILVKGAESPISLPRLVCSLLLTSQYLLLTVMLVVKYYRAQGDGNDDKRENVVVEA
ncbi:B-cell receptor CD22-like [Sardina pilchardus]|uniref:B-cell receptor CD22-like n=1 Tax=Sardina pilchardus TaxID=27697 RepID=UPI002E108A9F